MKLFLLNEYVQKCVSVKVIKTVKFNRSVWFGSMNEKFPDIEPLFEIWSGFCSSSFSIDLKETHCVVNAHAHTTLIRKCCATDRLNTEY